MEYIVYVYVYVSPLSVLQLIHEQQTKATAGAADATDAADTAIMRLEFYEPAYPTATQAVELTRYRISTMSYHLR